LDPEGKHQEPSCPLALKVGGKTFCFLSWGTYGLGRREDLEMALQDLSLEPLHCEIHPSPGGIRLVDRSGRTFLEGRPVEEVDLAPGMRLSLGEVPLEAVFREEAHRAYLVRPKRPPRRRAASGPGRNLRPALERYWRARGPSFSRELQRSLRSAPWFSLSLLGHLAILFLLWNLPVHKGGSAFHRVETAFQARLENEVPPGPAGPFEPEEVVSPEAPSILPPQPEPFEEDRFSPDPLEDPGIYLGLKGGSFTRKVLLAGGGRLGKAGGKGRGILSPHLLGTSPSFKKKIRALERTGLDVVLVLDATASMTFGLQLARSAFLEVFRALAVLVPDTRIALVVFRDPKEDPSGKRPVPQVPLSRNPWATMDFLEILSPGGGGGPRESLLSALARAISLLPGRSSRKAVILLVGDAPGHPEEEKDLRALVTRFRQERGGTLNTLFTGPPPERSPFHGEALEEFRELARLGGGRCVSLKSLEATSRWILALLTGEEDPGNPAKVLANLEARPTPLARIARRHLAKGETRWILERLSRNPVPPEVVHEILRRPDRSILEKILEGLDRKKARPFPLPSRQAFLYILKHLFPSLPLTPGEIREGRLSPEKAGKYLPSPGK